MFEAVNHPLHYNKQDRKECIVEMEEKYGIQKTAIFCLMNCYKYLYRVGMKEGAKEDIDKAKWYFAWCENRRLANHWTHIGAEKLYFDIREELRKYA